MKEMILFKNTIRHLTETELDKLIPFEMLDLDLRLEMHDIKYKINDKIKSLEEIGIVADWESREWMKGKSFKFLKNVYLKNRQTLNFFYEQLNRKYAVRKIQDDRPGDNIPF